MNNRPIHIVMTPVRNEAWVLRAFLTATSRWADYIIIADQMSTDGSRDIYKEFQSAFASSSASVSEHHCELIVIDNKNPEFNEAERQAMLVAKAREVAAGRDILLWGLDADEIFDAHFAETEDWQRIINSEVGSVFFFKWAEILPNQKEYRLGPSFYYPMVFHDDGVEPHANRVRKMHSMRIPYPKDEKLVFNVDDFRVLHLAYLNTHRVESKRRFYQFVDWTLNNRDCITLNRAYNQIFRNGNVYPLPDNFVDFKYIDGFNFFEAVDTQCTHCYMDEYVVERLNRYPIRKLRQLDMWDPEFLQEYQLSDPRTVLDKLLHGYLHKTKLLKDKLWVRALDKCLKKTLQIFG